MDFSIYFLYFRVESSTALTQNRDKTHAITVNTHHNTQPSAPSSLKAALPISGWQSGRSVIFEKGFKVTRAFIYDYLVERRTKSGPSNNFRALKSGYNMFASGHVQSVKMATTESHILYKATNLPSMKKDKPYSTHCSIDFVKKKMASAFCSCPAGISESCVHISALLHALECLFESSKNSLLASSAIGESKTSQECAWLKPRQRKVSATLAVNLM